MSARVLGLILLWLGTLLLVAVLQQRLRKGAWSEEAFERSPPVERLAVGLAVAGMAMAATGAALVVWDLW